MLHRIRRHASGGFLLHSAYARFTGHTSDVNTVAFSADNRQIVSGSRDRTIRPRRSQQPHETGRVQSHDTPARVRTVDVAITKVTSTAL